MNQSVHIGQLSRFGFRAASSAVIDACRDRFARAHYVRLTGLIEPRLLDAWDRAIEASPFRHRIHHDADYWGGDAPPADLLLDARDVLGRMLFIINDPALFRVIEGVARCGAIGSFAGVVYRMAARQGHSDRWHSDMGSNRLVALSMNLGREPYHGGRLQMRERPTGVICNEVTNTGFGDAILFKLSDHLQHRVAEVEPGPSRTVLTGWFVSTPSYQDWLQGLPGAHLL